MKKTKSSPRRQMWKKPWDFLFAAAGLSVGLGNVWRFPYLCFSNGGGAFLIPYFCFVVLVALPLMIMELSLGQRFRRGLAQSWGTIPLFKGIAFAECVLMIHSNVYYPILLVWAFKYLVHSFSTVLPWSHCNNTWNTPQCVSPSGAVSDNLANMTEGNYSILSSNAARVSAGREYWNYEVLGISSGIEQIGSIQGELVLYLFIIWIATYFCTFKGIKWTAKIVYFTATSPFILITIILVRGVTLDGAGEGIKFYLIPNMTKLRDPEVWVSAGAQVLYSYGTSCGAQITLGSFNDYHHNFLSDSIIIAFLNIVASFMSGFGVFSTLGFMANYQNTTVEQVAKSGPGLAFVAYPETLSLLPCPQLWCVIFFITLLFLGYDSQFVYLECFTTFVLDNVPRIRSIRHSRMILQILLCVSMFIGGLTMVTDVFMVVRAIMSAMKMDTEKSIATEDRRAVKTLAKKDVFLAAKRPRYAPFSCMTTFHLSSVAGVYIFEIYNNYAVAGWCIFFIATCEFVAIGWMFGADRYWIEVKKMIGDRWGRTWLILSWKYIGPCVCAAVAVYYLSGQTTMKYDDYVYPTWAQAVAYLMSISSIATIPGYAVYKVVKTWFNGGDLRQLIRKIDMPDEDNRYNYCASFDVNLEEIKVQPLNVPTSEGGELLQQ